MFCYSLVLLRLFHLLCWSFLVWHHSICSFLLLLPVLLVFYPNSLVQTDALYWFLYNFFNGFRLSPFSIFELIFLLVQKANQQEDEHALPISQVSSTQVVSPTLTFHSFYRLKTPLFLSIWVCLPGLGPAGVLYSSLVCRAELIKLKGLFCKCLFSQDKEKEDLAEQARVQRQNPQ